jgi:hypothetical protein
MFIRKRQGRTRPSYQLLESYREDGKIKQRVVYSLRGHATVKEALTAKREHVASIKKMWSGPPRNYREARMKPEMMAYLAEAEADLAKLEAVARSVKSIVSA